MTFKTRLRDGIYDAIGGLFVQDWFTGLARAFYRNRRTIVFYHAVWQSQDPRLGLFGGITLDTLARDLSHLKKIFRFAALHDVLEDVNHTADDPPTLAMSFDDGFDLIAGGAADLLQDMGINATVFVNTEAYCYERILWPHAFMLIYTMRDEDTFLRSFNAVQLKYKLGNPITSFAGFIDATVVWPQSRINDLADEIWDLAGMPDMQSILQEHKPYMNREGLRQWLSKGHGIGFHGKSHAWSSRFTAGDLEQQIIVAGSNVKSDFGLDRFPFAYAFGDRLSNTQESRLIDSGVFSCALGTDRLSRKGESVFVTDRIELDFGLPRHLFGTSLVRSIRGQDRLPTKVQPAADV